MDDWSTLMTLALKELSLAEDDLRLIHMDPKYLDRAKVKILDAQVKLLQLSEWIDEEEDRASLRRGRQTKSKKAVAASQKKTLAH